LVVTTTKRPARNRFLALTAQQRAALLALLKSL
jgi:CxxC motif-containing protein (DUF1111 family)